MDSFSWCKAVPVALSAYLTYKIAMCPCQEMMGCTKGAALMLITALGLMVIFGWPLK